MCVIHVTIIISYSQGIIQAIFEDIDLEVYDFEEFEAFERRLRLQKQALFLYIYC